MRYPFPSAALLFAAIAASGQTAKHPFNVDDWAALHTASPAAISPDGLTILCHVVWGGEKGPNQEEWRLIAKDGSNPRKLELPEHFTPAGFTRAGDGLYGTYEVNKLPQLAVFALAGLKKTATPTLMVALPAGIHSALLSPDGSRYALLADPRLPDDLAEVHTVIEAQPTSLYIVGADGTGGKWWCPTLKNISDTPGAQNVTGTAAIAWSTDGQSLAVLSVTPKIGNHSVHSNIDVCTAEGVRRVAEIPTSVSSIGWGSGGQEVVFLSTTTSVLTPDHVWSVPVAGGMPVDRTPQLKGSAIDLIGDPHGQVWVLVNRGVESGIDSFAEGALTPAFRWPGGVIAGVPVFPRLASSPAQLALTVSDPTHAPNVAIPEGGQLRKITSEADEQLARVDLGPVRVVHWTSKEGIPLEGLVTFPAGYVEGRRYPFLALPHGGPEANDQLALDLGSRIVRIVAGLGYVVLQPEYRGSTGYGSEFLNAIYQHFGDRAYRDVDSATDFAIAQGWADPNRLAIFGWSAGGFMTSWTVTQTSRYKAAIEGAGITEWASFLWTSDVPQFDYDGRWPEEDPGAFTQFSATAYANRVTTPILILHGAADLRVPTYQGREFFEALLARGKTTRMVTYPGSPHFPTLWEQRRDVIRELSAWLARYNP
jgi:dipeptidyl aminopeptidase/acylaminoacyl peptidase